MDKIDYFEDNYNEMGKIPFVRPSPCPPMGFDNHHGSWVKWDDMSLFVDVDGDVCVSCTDENLFWGNIYTYKARSDPHLIQCEAEFQRRFILPDAKAFIDLDHVLCYGTSPVHLEIMW